MMDTRVRRQNPSVTLQMYEVYNELVKDLLQVPGSHGAYLELAESAEKGIYPKVRCYGKTIFVLTLETFCLPLLEKSAQRI